MNKITFFILAILSSSNAFSSWNLLIKIKSDTYYYYDPDSIKKNGNLVSLNFLVNYTKPEPSESGIPVYSNISRAEFDCSKNKYRTLKSDHYTKNMGTGDIVSGFVEAWPPWIDIWFSESVIDKKRDLACNNVK
jgi:hypothetical protein